MMQRDRRSLVQCTARYGGERKAETVETFLAAVTVFKELEEIGDSQALKGLPLVLSSDAAVWWHGVKNEVKTWKDFQDKLRHTFAPKRMAYKIYQEIIEIKQDGHMPIDLFISKKRALFAELPAPKHTENQQIDMMFGQIRLNIREKIVRSDVKTFDDLLNKARVVERNLAERNKVQKPTTSQESNEFVKNTSQNQTRKRCNFCHNIGHTIDVCRKKAAAEAAKKPALPTGAVVPGTSKTQITCYGCGAPGVVRSRCPKCTKSKQSSTFEEIAFCALNTDADSRRRPTVPVTIAGEKGIAHIDTCAKSSVASHDLYLRLKKHGYQFKEQVMYITLADGIAKRQKVLSVKTPVTIYGRVIPTSFLVLPEARKNRTLLGVGFIQDALMILNLPQLTCNFLDEPERVYNLLEEKVDSSTIIANLVTETALPEQISPLSLTSEEAESPEVMTLEEDLQRPYGPLIPIEMENPKTPIRIENIGRWPDELIRIQERTPPKRKIPNFEAHSPVIDALYADARKQIDEVDIELSPRSKRLFQSPSTEIASLDTSLTTMQEVELGILLKKNAAVFEANGRPTTVAEHTIDTGNHRPVSVRPYRLSPAKTQALKKEIEMMLTDGIIKPCHSPWSAPVVMIPKKDGGTRVCIDYRQLNSITVPDVYPLPRIDDLLSNAKPTPFMTTCDLRAGYWQIKVCEEDQLKTTFVTPFGMYKFLRMPFGLRNAPATFQRMMDVFRLSLSHIKLLIYLDDIIILSTTFEEHLKDLQAVFDRLKEYNLTANREKCHFCCSRIKYLGHYITPQGLALDPEKVLAINKMKPPSNVKHLLTFLQMCSWYRRFVQNFAKVTEPLSRLTKKNVEWKWETEQQTAFNRLRELLVNAPILAQVDESKPFIIKTDASGYAVGAVLVQGEGEQEHPIEYASRLLNAAERNYSTTEREALAVVWAVNKFRGYIEGSPITLLTDHQALKWLMSLKSPTGRLARWALQLQPYDITIKYITGRTNVVADALSRPSCSTENTEDCGICSIIVDIPSKTAKEVRDEQMKDEIIKKIIIALEGSIEEEAKYWSKKGYILNDGIVYRYTQDDDSDDSQIVVPSQEQDKIIKTYHDDPTAGHYGIEKTIERITKRYYWKGMRKYITNYVRNCLECQRYKPSNLKPSGLLQTTATNQRFEVIAFDLFGPLPRSPKNHNWIFIIEDVATRWVELFALEHATAEVCATTLINEIFLRFGFPRRVISDNGTQFVSAIMQQVTYCLDIQHGFTPVYHPETNPVERRNRDLKTQLAILVGNDHTSWAEKLPSIRFAMNTAQSSSTGYTSAYLTFGRELRTPDDVNRDLKEIIHNENFIPEITPKLLIMTDVMRKARETSETKEEKRKEYMDKKRKPCPNFNTGDHVMVNTHVLSNAAHGFSSKLAPRRDGPYIIIKRHGPSSFEVANPKTPTISAGLYHASALRHYQNTNMTPLPQPAQPIRKRGRPRKALIENIDTRSD